VADALTQRGVLRVVSPGQLSAAMQQQDEQRATLTSPTDPQVVSALAQFIKTQYDIMRRHRDTVSAGWSERLLSAMRMFNGTYDTSKLQEIRKFGGSEVYARIVSMKCRGASSLLRDIYLGPERPWGLDPDEDPQIPPEILEAVRSLVTSESDSLSMSGAPPDPGKIRDRVTMLIEAARDAAKRRAKDQAKVSEEKLDEILVEGKFYDAFADFLIDLPLFPYAVMKGPEVRIVPTVSWLNGQATTAQKPRLFWKRCSPFDVYWTPGVANIEDANVIERTRVTRADLNDLLDLPGYDVQAVRNVLTDYGRGGLQDNWDTTDSERAVQENRENPNFNQSGLISCLEFHGNVQGTTLLEGGFPPKQIDDPIRDYFVQAWMIGPYVVKVQMAPSPRKRHPYYSTSFEKVPGTPVGNGLPDILSDIQEVANATLRSLVNNLSISSGPQVVVQVDRVAPDADIQSLYPWKRWLVTSDPMGNSAQKPVDFFQPNSNAGDLIQIYGKFSDLADEMSAIPKYLSGNYSGGAGRTASGLAMLMGNASKILQTVAANIDRDVIKPALDALYDMVMLTDTSGLLTGQENVRVMGVQVAVQKETMRARQMEFLQATGNPIDLQIIGPQGRAAVLRSVAQGIGLDGEDIVPSEAEIQEKMNAAPPPGAPPAPGQPSPPGVSPEPGAGGGSQLPPGAQKELGQAAAPQNQPHDQNRGMASGGMVDTQRTDVVSGGMHG
jgi:hypothetical protein